MKRKGFTLIEMLVVMLIIGTLMALLLAGLSAVRAKGRETQARTEIGEIQMACSQFKAAFGAPPACSGYGNSGAFRLATKYTDAAGNPLTDPGNGNRIWPEIEYLMEIFPNMNLNDNGLRWPNTTTIVDGGNPIHLDGNAAMFFFLTGGGQYTGRSGFSSNPRQPFSPPPAVGSSQRRGPWFQSSSEARWLDNSGVDIGRFRDPWGTPYACLGYLRSSKAQTGSAYPAAVSCFGVAPFKDTTGKFINADSVQIISAGKNKLFGPGGTFNPGTGSYSPGQPGEDDLSNFRQSILGTDR